MVIVMSEKAQDEQVQEIVQVLKTTGLGVHLSKGASVTIIGVIGDKRLLENVPVELMPGVDKVVHIMDSFKLASKAFKPESSVIDIKGAKIGGKEIAMIAGPCSIENEEQMSIVAAAIKKSGAKFIRGGAFKPRTSPYAFQGLEEEGLKIIRNAAAQNDLMVVSEVVSLRAVEIAYDYIDVFQIGARNVQNFELLKEVGKANKPVVLKRGPSTTIEEWLNAAEYIMSEGNHNIILCERGIRTFENSTRNTLDISAVPVVKSKSHLPIIIDPSHAAGRASYVPSLSKAAIAAGADGLLIEVHPDPKHALSDAAQQITPEDFDQLCKEISLIAPILEREFKYGN